MLLLNRSTTKQKPTINQTSAMTAMTTFSHPLTGTRELYRLFAHTIKHQTCQALRRGTAR